MNISLNIFIPDGAVLCLLLQFKLTRKGTFETKTAISVLVTDVSLVLFSYSNYKTKQKEEWVAIQLYI